MTQPPKDAAEAEMQKAADVYFLGISRSLPHQRAFEGGYSAGLKAAEGRWISVQERLPDCHHFVLGLYCSNPAHVVPLIRNEDGTWKSILNGFTADAITHWMPLPPAPEKGE